MSKFLFLPVLVVIACTSSTSPNSQFVETSPTDIPSSTTIELMEVRPDDHLSGDTTNTASDSSVYIGELSAFQETGELYTSLYYRSDVVTVELFDYLHKQIDSVIYEDAEIQRGRVPVSIARSYFNLFGLDTISIYQKADYVCNAQFVRVEYMEDMIEGRFVAVFKPLGKTILPEELDYCISGGKHSYKTNPVWSSLAVFSGEEYRICEANRVGGF